MNESPGEAAAEAEPAEPDVHRGGQEDPAQEDPPGQGRPGPLADLSELLVRFPSVGEFHILPDLQIQS